MFVIVYNLAPSELQKEGLEKIEPALRLAIVNVVPEIEPLSGEIGFSFPQDPSVTDQDEDIPVLIVVEGFKDPQGKKQDLAEEIHKYFIQVAPKPERRVEVLVRNLFPSDGYYIG